jgi:hypothetical protein
MKKQHEIYIRVAVDDYHHLLLLMRLQWLVLVRMSLVTLIDLRIDF